MGQLGAGLGARDRLLLEATADLRLVSGGQLQRLMFSDPDASSTNTRIARRALQRLTDQGLLRRLRRTVGGLRAGSTSWVYCLTPRGAAAMGRRLGRGRSREPSLTFLEHALAVAETYVMLREAQAAFSSLSLETEPACWRVLEDGSGSVLRPDLLVVAGRTDDELLAFVEVDLATEHQAALRRKLALYRAHYLAGTEQRLEGVFPEVLWVSESDKRREELAALFAREDPDRLHRAVSQQQLIDYLKGGDHA